MKRQTTKPKGFDPARRAALLKLGRFAVYTAPVMSTLLIGEASANHEIPPKPCNNPTNPLYVAQHCTPLGSSGASPSAEGFSDQKTKDQPSTDGF